MDTVILPWQLMLLSLVGWLNRNQQSVINYKKGENWTLKEQIDERRKGKVFGVTEWTVI